MKTSKIFNFLTNVRDRFRISWIKNNISLVISLSMYVSVNLALMIYVLVIRWDSNTATKFARIPGMLLNFNGSLIYLLVLKRIITWWRNSFLGRNLHFLDEVLQFHKFIGFFILFLSIIHSFGHFFNLWYLSTDYSSSNTAGSYSALLFTTQSGLGWVGGSACPTGWVLLLILAIIVAFALPCIRRKGHFQAFFYTHLLYILFAAVLIIHAPNYWAWFLGPLALTIIERLYTKLRVNSNKFGEFYIQDVVLLPSRVTNLIIKRPRGFHFNAGDYIFIRLPRIAGQEWHPFTISSSPEQEGLLTVHIRSLGQWTNKIYDFFDKLNTNTNLFELNTIQLDNEFYVESTDSNNLNKKNLNTAKKLKGVDIKVYVDGSFGTSSGRILDSEHAVLISAGIGVTPFASIIQSLWFRYLNALKKCPKCTHEFYDSIDMRLFKKVDFIWTNRDFGAFEWFVQLLGEIELQQLNSGSRFLDIHLFMTSLKNTQLIKKSGKSNNPKEDSFSLSLNPGRPNLDKIFEKISNEKKGEVSVFFCGPPELGKQVEEKCVKFKFKFSKEYF